MSFLKQEKFQKQFMLNAGAMNWTEGGTILTNQATGFVHSAAILELKEPNPIFSTFFQTFGDFRITRKLMANFTAEKHSIWKILMKMWQVMVTITKLTQ